MITKELKELIAKAICQFGHCEKCDEDCIDYEAAQRVVAALKSNGVEIAEEEVSKDGTLS